MEKGMRKRSFILKLNACLPQRGICEGGKCNGTEKKNYIDDQDTVEDARDTVEGEKTTKMAENGSRFLEKHNYGGGGKRRYISLAQYVQIPSLISRCVYLANECGRIQKNRAMVGRRIGNSSSQRIRHAQMVRPNRSQRWDSIRKRNVRRESETMMEKKVVPDPGQSRWMKLIRKWLKNPLSDALTSNTRE